MLSFLVPALFVADVASSTPADTTWFALTLDGAITPSSSTFGAASANSGASGLRAGGDAEVSAYLFAPIRDDATPFSLQPFLQRTSFVSFQGGASAIGYRYSAGAGGGTYSQVFTPDFVSTRVFLTDSVALLGSIGVDYLHDTRTPLAARVVTDDVWEPWGSLGVDLRSGDSSLTLQWQLVGVNETTTDAASGWRSVFWPRAALAGRTVLDNRVDLSASVAAIPDGVDVKASVGVYPTKELGLSLLGEGRHGQIYWNSTTDYDSLLGGGEVSYWVDPRINVALSATPTWVNWATGTQWVVPVVLVGTARLP